jgi:hypothetical protein
MMATTRAACTGPVRDGGERVRLPANRAAETARLIVAEGFSCREQIRQMTGRHALHLADVLAKALKMPGASAAA